MSEAFHGPVCPSTWASACTFAEPPCLWAESGKTVPASCARAAAGMAASPAKTSGRMYFFISVLWEKGRGHYLAWTEGYHSDATRQGLMAPHLRGLFAPGQHIGMVPAPYRPQQVHARCTKEEHMRNRTVAIIGSLLFALAAFAMPTRAFAQVAVGISVGFAPPDLPVYEQPECPGDDYIWTPGYWAWDGEDYYWVPGTWVLAPEPGLFWTPPYWGWNGVAFVFYDG